MQASVVAKTQTSAVEDRAKKLSLLIQSQVKEGRNPSELVDMLLTFSYPYDAVYEACEQAEKALNVEILVPLTLS